VWSRPDIEPRENRDEWAQRLVSACATAGEIGGKSFLNSHMSDITRQSTATYNQKTKERQKLTNIKILQ
jgi:hypothetical protein